MFGFGNLKKIFVWQKRVNEHSDCYNRVNLPILIVIIGLFRLLVTCGEKV